MTSFLNESENAKMKIFSLEVFYKKNPKKLPSLFSISHFCFSFFFGCAKSFYFYLLILWEQKKWHVESIFFLEMRERVIKLQ